MRDIDDVEKIVLITGNHRVHPMSGLSTLKDGKSCFIHYIARDIVAICKVEIHEFTCKVSAQEQLEIEAKQDQVLLNSRMQAGFGPGI